MKYIYVLVDPTTAQVRYVGQAANPRTRYYNHLKAKEFGDKADWIRSLKATGTYPILYILEACDTSLSYQKETEWIDRLRTQNQGLFNMRLPKSKNRKCWYVYYTPEMEESLSKWMKENRINSVNKAVMEVVGWGLKYDEATTALRQMVFKLQDQLAEAKDAYSDTIDRRFTKIEKALRQQGLDI